MDELVSWLLTQKGGVATYIEFQEKTFALWQAGTEHAAGVRLLADLTDAFATKYFEDPLPDHVAEKARRQLLDLTERFAASLSRNAEAQLAVLNEIARADLG